MPKTVQKVQTPKQAICRKCRGKRVITIHAYGLTRKAVCPMCGGTGVTGYQTK